MDFPNHILPKHIFFKLFFQADFKNILVFILMTNKWIHQKINNMKLKKQLVKWNLKFYPNLFLLNC